MVTRKKIIFISLISSLLLGGAFVWWQSTRDNENSGEDFKPKAEVQDQTLPPVEEESIPAPSAESTPNLTVTNITNGDNIRNGTKIEGTARSPEGILHITIKGASTGKVADYTIKVTASSTTAQTYSATLIYERPPQPGEKGLLDVYTKEDGVRAYSRQIEVTLQ